MEKLKANVKYKIKSVTAKLANYIKGGGVLEIQPDDCWKPLFDKAEEQRNMKEQNKKAD